MSLEILGTVATVAAIIGVILNNHRRRTCFIVWLGSNGITLSVHLALGVYSLAARDAAFLALAVHGWFQWGRKTP